jgi:3',5'-cyclic AMP phosphodiesterase CpdA
MRTLVHLSDLHFGHVDQRLLEPLTRAVGALRPDLVAVSGDLTQRARSDQFRAARIFLDALPRPQIVVPGNHDVPLHNIYSRFLQPLHKYRRYITDDLEPFYADEEIAVIGINTTRSWTIKGGRINELQVAQIRARLFAHGAPVVKVVVTHHPFDLPEGHRERDLVGRARMAMGRLAECGAELFLAGHLHVTHTGQTAKRYQILGHSALVVQAGTASSTRGRGEANSFNVVRIDRPRIVVERFQWQQETGDFSSASQEVFRQTNEGWVRA